MHKHTLHAGMRTAYHRTTHHDARRAHRYVNFTLDAEQAGAFIASACLLFSEWQPKTKRTAPGQ